MFFTPNVSREFSTSAEVFEWACETYNTDRTRTKFTWNVMASYTTASGKNVTIYTVQISEPGFHEFFTVLEADTLFDT